MIYNRSPLKTKINILLASSTTTPEQRNILCKLMDDLIIHYQRKNPHEIHGFCSVDKTDSTKREYF